MAIVQSDFRVWSRADLRRQCLWGRARFQIDDFTLILGFESAIGQGGLFAPLRAEQVICRITSPRRRLMVSPAPARRSENPARFRRASRSARRACPPLLRP